jgi:hypothetical protein
MDPSQNFYYPSGFDPTNPYLPPTPTTAFEQDTTLQPSFHTYEPPATPFTSLHTPFTGQPGFAAPFDASINEQLARLIAAKQEELGHAAMTDPAEATASRWVGSVVHS